MTMGFGLKMALSTIGGVARKFGAWVSKNPETAMAVMQKVDSLCSGRAYEPNNHGDRLLVAEQRLNQLQEKTEKLNKKVEAKTAALQTQMEVMAKQLRTLKIWLTVISVTLALAIAAVAIFAFWL